MSKKITIIDYKNGEYYTFEWEDIVAFSHRGAYVEVQMIDGSIHKFEKRTFETKLLK